MKIAYKETTDDAPMVMEVSDLVKSSLDLTHIINPQDEVFMLQNQMRNTNHLMANLIDLLFAQGTINTRLLEELLQKREGSITTPRNFF
jgi:hypothetical protein